MIANAYESSVCVNQAQNQTISRLDALSNESRKFKNSCQLFEEQAKRHPDKVAVIFENKKLTYKELEKRSNQLARYLQQHGVQKGAFVGFSLHNSLDLIVGILGILKAGGVYVPIEPNYPHDRINYMLQDAKPSVLMIESSLLGQFSGFSGEIIQLDRVWDAISVLSDSPLDDTIIQPQDLAYIIYTSGSTGVPKGIMVEHGSFAHGATAHQEFYQEKLIGLLSGAISFDVSVLIIFHLLLSEGTICVPPQKSLIDATDLVALIENHSINYILCVPSLYSMILDKSRKLPSLKIVSLAGENIPNSIVVLHPQLAPNAILYNEYGPTEYAIGTTLAKIYDPQKKEVYSINVGKPLPDTHVYIFDENLSPVVNGDKGEIFIRGAGIARGYLNKPELTSEKFISVQSMALYRTGDFGRFLPDGSLEFLGRMDHQVKIHGNRVELGEIEHAICRNPQVDEAAVITCEGPCESKHLVAYFTALVDEEIEQELKMHLAKSLPKYMIPSVFVQIQTFPRTPNGKIDRKVLPSLFNKRKSDIEESQSELERVLVSTWKSILYLDSISSKDNFFEIGGDSLGIARVQTLIETDLAIEISVAELFQYPTISQLARYLTTREIKKPHSESHRKLAKNQKAAFQRFKKFHRGGLI